jgi:ribonuclease P/MRP protein subunit RPP20
VWHEARKPVAAMFFSLKEITRLLGLTPVEIWMQMVGLIFFSVLFVLKIEGILSVNWWLIFIPLFAADGIHCYFIYIVLLRMILAGMYKAAPLRALWSFSILGLYSVFKFLLCMKLNGQSSMDYAEVLAPIMMLLQLQLIRACQIQ